MKKVSNWNSYFIALADTTSLRSKDPTTQVGCVVVDKNNHAIGLGFNGFPQGMVETEELWQRPTKYNYVIHAEANSLLNCSDLSKAYKIYCSLYPCPNCAKLIAGAGIKKVYYKDHELNGKSYLDPVSQDIFSRCGVEVVQVK